MELKDIIKALESSKKDYLDITPNDFPNKPGLYAIFLAKNDDIPEQFNGFGLSVCDCLYVGKSESSLRDRDLGTHFNSGTTGRSTLRRTFGAILKEPLQLRAVPRGGENDTNRFRNYKFDDESEEKLTHWMRNHLAIGNCPVEDNDINLKNIENDVIYAMQPLLNLTKWQNPNTKAIKEFRAICKEEAKRNS